MIARINKIINFIGKQWVGVVIAMVMALFLFWTIGYFSNGIYGTKFELQSCWLGVGAITTAGAIGLGKYFTDSKHNSESGKSPINKGE